MKLQVKRSVMLFFGLWVTNVVIMLLLFAYHHIPITIDLAIETCGAFALVAALVAAIQVMTDNSKRQR